MEMFAFDCPMLVLSLNWDIISVLEISGYGTRSIRLSKDSVRGFDCCCLTLQPCRDPVMTPDGYLYDKEAIFSALLRQKKEAALKMKAYEKQLKEQQKETSAIAASEEQAKVEAFKATENSITSKTSTFTSKASIQSDLKASSSSSTTEDKNLTSFWVPSLTPQAKPTLIKKPDNKTYCPMSGKPIKIKDLIPVEFTEIVDKDDKRSLICKDARYMCPITHDTLSNSVPAAVLRSSGKVVSMESIEKIVKKDMIDPFTSTKITEKDIIVLQRGGTGFSAANEGLQAKLARPVMSIS
ncbi:Nitric oxide synthase-interacting protein [Trichoplax sp. H2]|nr:Nitric oxide synthase-interacting protein [Trichoplax sp. H2]|eukprot:RDD45794.1 Nitric oxide synthase-interacting protein [Trichoplax sp. H2]